VSLGERRDRGEVDLELIASVRTTLAKGQGRSRRVEAAIRLATDFHAWRALAPLGDEAAAELAAGLVAAARVP
jgi:hypothetical protein